MAIAPKEVTIQRPHFFSWGSETKAVRAQAERTAMQLGTINAISISAELALFSHELAVITRDITITTIVVKTPIVVSIF